MNMSCIIYMMPHAYFPRRLASIRYLSPSLPTPTFGISLPPSLPSGFPKEKGT